MKRSMKQVLVCILCGCLLAATGVNGEEARVWTDIKGRKVEAVLAGYDGYFVYLNVRGKRSKVAIDNFIEADREYIEKRAAEVKSTRTAKENAERRKRESVIDFRMVDGRVEKDE